MLFLGANGAFSNSNHDAVHVFGTLPGFHFVFSKNVDECLFLFVFTDYNGMGAF